MEHKQQFEGSSGAGSERAHLSPASHKSTDMDQDRPLTVEEQAILARMAVRSERAMRTGTRQVIWANGEVETVTYEVL